MLSLDTTKESSASVLFLVSLYTKKNDIHLSQPVKIVPVKKYGLKDSLQDSASRESSRRTGSGRLGGCQAPGGQDCDSF